MKTQRRFGTGWMIATLLLGGCAQGPEFPMDGETEWDLTAPISASPGGGCSPDQVPRGDRQAVESRMEAWRQPCLPAAIRLLELGGCPKPPQSLTESQRRRLPRRPPPFPVCLGMAFHQGILPEEDYAECTAALKKVFQGCSPWERAPETVTQRPF